MSIRLSSDGLSFWTTGATTKAVSETSADTPSRRSVSHLNTGVKAGTQIVFDKRFEKEERLRRAFSRVMEKAGDGIIETYIILDSRKSILVPKALLDSDTNKIYDLFSYNNIGLDEEEPVVIDLTADIICVVACDSLCVKLVFEHFGSNIGFESPFAVNLAYPSKYPPKEKKRHELYSAVYLAGSNAYITVAENSGELKYCEVLPCSGSADLLYYFRKLEIEFDIKKSPLYISGAGCEEARKVLKKHFRKSRCE